MSITKSQILCSLVAIVLAGCGGPPADNPLLLEAREIYNTAATDRSVLVNAEVELEDAQAELAKAELAWRAKEDKIIVDHHAYMAKQRSRIAIETAKLKSTDDEVQKADIERKQVQLEARSVEAERAALVAEQRRLEAEKERALADVARRQAESARDEAESARSKAEQARMEADAAMQRMQEMTDKLAELEARQTERGLVLTLGDVLFDVGQSTLKAGGTRAAAQLAQFMLEYPERRVLVEGYTDAVGSEETNLRLSERRAQAVKDALMQQGISSGRVETRGYGEDYPIAGNGTSDGRRQNRRVEVVISDEKGVIKPRN